MFPILFLPWPLLGSKDLNLAVLLLTRKSVCRSNSVLLVGTS